MATVDNLLTILIVDDNISIAELIREQIRMHYGSTVQCILASSGEEALKCLESAISSPVDIIISDVEMPGMGGVELLRKVMEMYPRTYRILLSGYADFDRLASALNDCGISSFIGKPCRAAQLYMILDNAVTAIKLQRENYSLSISLQESFQELLKLLTNMMAELAPDLVECGRETSKLCSVIARELGVDASDISDLETAAMYHAVGMIGMPKEYRRMAVTQLSGEFRLMYLRYTETSCEMLKAIPRIAKARDYIRLHQENIDGTGMLKVTEKEIPLPAKILRVVSFFTSATVLRGEEPRVVIDRMTRRVESWFDPKVMQAFIRGISKRMGSILVPMKLSEVQPGMKVGADVKSKSGRLILPVGTTITAINLRRLVLYSELDPILEVVISVSES